LLTINTGTFCEHYQHVEPGAAIDIRSIRASVHSNNHFFPSPSPVGFTRAPLSSSLTDAQNTTKYGNSGVSVMAVVYTSFNYEDIVGGVFMETYDMGFLDALAQQAVKNVKQYSQL
jgi:hypothetical protein